MRTRGRVEKTPECFHWLHNWLSTHAPGGARRAVRLHGLGGAEFAGRARHVHGRVGAAIVLAIGGGGRLGTVFSAPGDREEEEEDKNAGNEKMRQWQVNREFEMSMAATRGLRIENGMVRLRYSAVLSAMSVSLQRTPCRNLDPDCRCSRSTCPWQQYCCHCFGTWQPRCPSLLEVARGENTVEGNACGGAKTVRVGTRRMSENSRRRDLKTGGASVG
jgi:hypothetical protein